MNKDMLLDNLADNLLIKWGTKYIPISPLIMWADTNRGLENNYKTLNIGDDEQGKDIKNTMRHITGLARTTQAYGAPIARTLGLVKETADFWNGNNDNAIDFKNNNAGIDFVLRHPNASRYEIMDFALKRALNKNKPLKSLADISAE